MDSYYVTSGTATNGHTRYWGVWPARGFVGPFRATRERAQADLDALDKPGQWEVRQEGGQNYVGRSNPAVPGGIEYVSTPAGRNVRYGTIARAREEARHLNRKEAQK